MKVKCIFNLLFFHPGILMKMKMYYFFHPFIFPSFIVNNMPCQAPAKTTKTMKHFRKQNKIHAGQTTVSHNQHDTLSNKHNINVKLRFIVCKNRDKLLATHITHQEKTIHQNASDKP